MNNSMRELDGVRLKSAFSDLPAGATGTIVLEYDRECFEVEFFDENGDTIDVVTTPIELLELVQSY